MNKNLRGILQVCAVLDVGILGVISGLLVFWFDGDNSEASNTLGFISVFSYLALFLFIIPTLSITNQMQRKKEVFLPLLYLVITIIGALVQGVLIFLMWFFADSTLSKFDSSFDSASITFIIVTGFSILLKIVTVISFLYSMNTESDGAEESGTTLLLEGEDVQDPNF